MDQLGQAAEHTLLVLSSNDPYCHIKDVPMYLDCGVPVVMLPNLGHINVGFGHGPWVWIRELCLKGEIHLI
jgi:uncharacterized protein